VGFDWFTFVAQIVNFLILVALLRYFLYRPILEAMNRREEAIQSRLHEAEQTKEEAEREAEQLRQERAELERKRDELITKAREEAENQRKALIAEARREVDNTRTRWQEAIERERESFLSELRETVAHQTSAAIRNILGDLADEALEGKVIEQFLKRLDEMDDDSKKEIAQALADREGTIAVRSAFEIPAEEAEEIREAMKKHFDPKAEIQFETASELRCGIELRVAGHKLGWNVEDSVRDLEASFLQVFEDYGSGKEEGQGSEEQEEKEEKERKE